MKSLYVLTALSVLAPQYLQAEDPKSAYAPGVIKGTFVIQGLHCPPCTRTVEAALAKTKGVQSAKVDWKTKNAWLTFDEGVISAQQVAQTIAGTPHMMGGGMHYKGTLALKVEGLKDEGANKTAKDALSQVPGVSKVYIYPQQQSAVVEFADKGKTTSQQLIEALTKAGFPTALFK